MSKKIAKDVESEDEVAARRKAGEAQFASVPLWIIAAASFAVKFASLALTHGRQLTGERTEVHLVTGILASLFVWVLFTPLARWMLRISWRLSGRIVGAACVGMLLARVIYVLLFLR